MAHVSLSSVPPLATGIGARAALPELVGAAGSVLLVADGGLKTTGMVDEIVALLTKAARTVTTFSEFSSDPTIAQTDAAAELARKTKADCIVSLGGGSALDLGKAVATIAGETESAAAYELCRKDFPAGRLRSICVPTTSGTGSEATRTSVLTRADKAKVWLWGEAIKADAIVLDPELTASLPAHLTAATGIDALVHAVEAATNRSASTANNVYAHAAIKLVADNLQRAVADGGDLEARDALQRAATLAGVAIDNAGTAIAHNIGHAMASLKPIHHGLAVGIAMLKTLPWSVGANPKAFAACAAAMGASASADGFIAAYERLFHAVGLTSDLGDRFAGVGVDALVRQMEQPENAPMLNSNVKPPTRSEMVGFATRILLEKDHP